MKIKYFSNPSIHTVCLISWLFFMAIFFFSGSIYAITIGEINPKLIWFITPLGGLLFIIGWLLMLIAFIKKR